jgi:hypothetical protein
MECPYMLWTHRFGTGFDMMKTGYDANGVWTVIEAGLA